MSTLITVLHIIVCLFLMLTVLLQSGKGGGMGGAFGGGNAATVFGGSGASSFLKRLTAGAGTIFMLTSMLLAFLASHDSADALTKFGEQQAKLAAEREAAKKKDLAVPGGGSGSAIKGPTTGSGAGGPSEMVPLTPIEGGSASTGSDAKPADAKPADAKPADAKPADAKPAK
jgi:preprotein translocase subunit SecG